MFGKDNLTLRIVLSLIMTVVILISILGTSYVLMRNARSALLEEKQVKLFAFAKLLDIALVKTYDEILQDKGLLDASREEKIRALNEELREITDYVANSEPGIGVGYYSKELDAIITYGPSNELGYYVGQPISTTHQGREVMRTGQAMVQTAFLVRGEIMNCMLPIQRGDEVIGYIWSNELVEDINNQINRLEYRFRLTIFFGILFSMVGAALIIDSVLSKVDLIKRGLKEVQKDLDYRLKPISGEMGEIVDAINEMAAALSQRKRLMEQMQRADRLAAIGEVAAGIAHEIRNPLTAIKGFIQLFEEELPEDDPKLVYTLIINREVDRMNKIISELLYYARPSEPQQVLVNINDVLESALFLVNFKTIKPKIKVTKNYNQSLPLISVDEEQIKQVFLNLIINSTQAIDTAGEIKLETDITADEKYVVAVVSDTGKGIAQSNLKKLFDPFFTTREKGTGLGLAVVHKIIELHEGQIEVESQVGQGTTFRLYLPVRREVVQDAQQSETDIGC